MASTRLGAGSAVLDVAFLGVCGRRFGIIWNLNRLLLRGLLRCPPGGGEVGERYAYSHQDHSDGCQGQVPAPAGIFPAALHPHGRDRRITAGAPRVVKGRGRPPYKSLLLFLHRW